MKYLSGISSDDDVNNNCTLGRNRELWITGSSDSSIKNVEPADLSIILNNANIEKIYANGDKAFKLYMKYTYPTTKREIIKLPSTSPANAKFTLDKLIDYWKCIKY